MKIAKKHLTNNCKNYIGHQTNKCLMDVCAGVQMLLSSDSVKVHEDVLSQVVLLKRLMTARMTDEQTRQICQVLNSLSDHCQAPHDALQAHTVNQNIITSHCQYRLDSLSSSSRLV